MYRLIERVHSPENFLMRTLISSVRHLNLQVALLLDIRWMGKSAHSTCIITGQFRYRAKFVLWLKLLSPEESLYKSWRFEITQSKRSSLNQQESVVRTFEYIFQNQE